MPDVQEVFRMATQKVKPDPGALERQHRDQRRRSTTRRVAVYGLVAALVAVIAVVALRAGGGTGERVPVGQPSSSTTTTSGNEAPVGTVTFDGSTCSMEITADGIEPGVVVFDVVNATDRKAMFDTWQLVNGYSFEEFATAIERLRRLEEDGKIPRGGFPEGEPTKEQQVRYLDSELIPANSSGSIVTSTISGTHAIVCMKPYQGLGLQPSAIVGPIVVQ